MTNLWQIINFLIRTPVKTPQYFLQNWHSKSFPPVGIFWCFVTIIADNNAFVTILPFKWLINSMNSLMPGYVRLANKTFITKLTFNSFNTTLISLIFINWIAHCRNPLTAPFNHFNFFYSFGKYEKNCKDGLCRP